MNQRECERLGHVGAGTFCSRCGALIHPRETPAVPKVRNPKWLIVLVSVFGVVLAIGLFGAIFGEEPDPTPDSTPDYQAAAPATATAAATTRESLRATATAAEIRKESLQPTNTTLLDSACTSPAVAEYLEALALLAREQGYEMGRFVEVASQLEVNPSLLLDDDWIFDMTIALSGLEAGAQSMLSLRAPPSASSINTPVKASARNMQASVKAITEGIENFDASALEEGATYMERSRQDFVRASSAMEDFC